MAHGKWIIREELNIGAVYKGVGRLQKSSGVLGAVLDSRLCVTRPSSIRLGDHVGSLKLATMQHLRNGNQQT